ncbi:AbrB/MazE/SpoVT family DNA-binding domain-containing protein [Leadbettera azotonutricia]|uniref:Conserved domain protein n=1 Tax=Leadbettera azotonutricia (strain ATCC BAA-888 / DSM 13862 / ZAS-9) TaxID=545695 RepID=F5YG77_LEAAZ|nr:AbrB/MazE/SpoVT family DNA-binding domain-containing protein [Leadbettera azotonutricia]AEF80976.1 conserved domain protein [Leadbettera azotonutricia ZAS-9]
MSEVMVVSTKGQITLPARVRTQFGIKSGDRIVGEYLNDGFVIRKPRDFSSLQGSLSGGKMPDDEEDLLTREAGKRMIERR